MQIVVPVLSRNGICYSFILRTPKVSYLHDYTDVLLEKLESYPVLLEQKTNVFFVYGEPTTIQGVRMFLFLADMFLLPPLGKVWILTSQWDFDSLTLYRSHTIQMFHGALSFTVHSNQPHRFQSFLQRIKPFWATGDGFIQDFWEQAFNCSLKMSSTYEGIKTKCTGEEKLKRLSSTIFEMNIFGHSYNVYNAVYAVAHALQAMFTSRPKYRTFPAGKRLEIHTVQPWQVI